MEENGIGQSDAAPIDDLVSKDRVTEIIKREKEAAYRKAQREYQAELDSLKTGQTQQMGGMQQAPQQQGLDAEALKAQVIEQLKAQYEEEQANAQQAEYKDFVSKQVESYLQKMDKGSGLAEDFHAMTAKFKPEKFKEVFFLANGLENTPAIIYELMSNPYKLANIDYLAKTDPDLAREQLESLSKSIDINQKALENNQSATPPLGRPKTSLAASPDSGAMSIKDFKKASWLRG